MDVDRHRHSGKSLVPGASSSRNTCIEWSPFPRSDLSISLQQILISLQATVSKKHQFAFFACIHKMNIPQQKNPGQGQHVSAAGVLLLWFILCCCPEAAADSTDRHQRMHPRGGFRGYHTGQTLRSHNSAVRSVCRSSAPGSPSGPRMH